jgi:hypothetical protein
MVFQDRSLTYHSIFIIHITPFNFTLHNSGGSEDIIKLTEKQLPTSKLLNLNVRKKLFLWHEWATVEIYIFFDHTISNAQKNSVYLGVQFRIILKRH